MPSIGARASVPAVKRGLIDDLGADVRAGVVVFLVALPLCLGIATASGAPPLAGLVAGVIGGVVVGLASGSSLSVAGPAAGLTVIVLDGITTFGFAGFLMVTMLAGLMQVGMGALRLGALVHFVPHAVIRGMLAAIGLILVLKQIPHAVGYDADYEGDFGFDQIDGHNTFSELLYSLEVVQPGAIAAAAGAGLAFALWRDYGRLRLRALVPAPLVAVVIGALVGVGLQGGELEIGASHLVTIPRLAGDLGALWNPPAWGALAEVAAWRAAAVLAAVASIESLLCVEATDRIDPLHRLTPSNRELVAQGLGNVASGALGGLPVTAVIVRSSANLQGGARTRFAAVFHGLLLAVAVLAFAEWLGRIPLAALAVVLLVVGGKLTPPRLYREMYAKGLNQFLPFIATVALILLTDLLTGTLLGVATGIYFVIRANYRSAVFVSIDGTNHYIRLAESVTFLNKGRLKAALEAVPAGGRVIVDGARTTFVDADIIDTLRDYEDLARAREVRVELRRLPVVIGRVVRREAPGPTDEQENGR